MKGTTRVKGADGVVSMLDVAIFGDPSGLSPSGRSLDVLLAESDIVSLHARVTPETTGFIGEPQFRRMKRGAYFINTARGPMVDYDALFVALVDGHLAGAGLETFAQEPPAPDWPLLKLPRLRRRHADPAHCWLFAGVGAAGRGHGLRRSGPVVRRAASAALCQPRRVEG